MLPVIHLDAVRNCPDNERVTCVLTPMRLQWLTFLAKSGRWEGWDRMPRKQGSPGAFRSRDGSALWCTNRTWRPMIDAGLIEGAVMQPDFRKNTQWHFRITFAGLAALSGLKVLPVAEVEGGV